MKKRAGSLIALAVVMLLALCSAMIEAEGQGAQAPAATAKPYTAPRTPDGQPDIRGIWAGTPGGSYNIQDLEFQSLYQNNRPNPAMRGKSRLIDPLNGKIPYQPWAAEKREFITSRHANPTLDTLDPSSRCWPHGVPRHLYNRELEIFQSPGYVIFFNMAHHSYRVIPVDGRPHIPENVKLFMGDSRGRWEGNTLVVDVANQNDQTWFDIVGDFHSDALHIAERFTIVSADTIAYEATLTDPKVYTRPWKMGLSLERNKDYGDELWEEACYESSQRSIEGMLNRPGQ